MNDSDMGTGWARRLIADAIEGRSAEPLHVSGWMFDAIKAKRGPARMGNLRRAERDPDYRDG